MDILNQVKEVTQKRDTLQVELNEWGTKAGATKAEADRLREARRDLLRMRADGARNDSALVKAEEALHLAERDEEIAKIKYEALEDAMAMTQRELEEVTALAAAHLRVGRWAENETYCAKLKVASDAALKDLSASIIAAGEAYTLLLAYRQRFVERGGDAYRAEIDAQLNHFTGAPGLAVVVNEEARLRGIMPLVVGHPLQVWPMLKAPDVLGSGQALAMPEVANRLGIEP